MSLLQAVLFFALVALSIADSGSNDFCLLECLDPEDAHLRATRQAERRLSRDGPNSASSKCSGIDEILRCILACPDDKYGQYAKPAFLKINSTYCKDAETFEKLAESFDKMEHAWIKQANLDSCDRRRSDDVENTCKIADTCTFRKSFVAVKRQFPVETADIYEAATKFETTMSLQMSFGKLPPA
ncbi:hypothetical protein AAVH_42235, partial [Aphelenchoides avenae]